MAGKKHEQPEVTVAHFEQALADHHQGQPGEGRSAINIKQLAANLVKLTPAVLAIASTLGVKIPGDPAKIAALIVQLSTLFKDQNPAPAPAA